MDLYNGDAIQPQQAEPLPTCTNKCFSQLAVPPDVFSLILYAKSTRDTLQGKKMERNCKEDLKNPHRMGSPAHFRGLSLFRIWIVTLRGRGALVHHPGLQIQLSTNRHCTPTSLTRCWGYMRIGASGLCRSIPAPISTANDPLPVGLCAGSLFQLSVVCRHKQLTTGSQTS